MTWLSGEEVRTVEISLLGSFQMRQKPHLGSPKKVRLWVKVMTLLNTLISLQGHAQLLECMLVFA